MAWILAAGLLLGGLCQKLHIPGLFGMILGGILIGPYVLNLIDGSMLAISSEIRRAALIIILIRAGLKLEPGDLKKNGRPAILMCFLPACFEIVGMLLLAPNLLGISWIEALVLGAVIAAVSPAVIVPRMIRLIDEGYGSEKGIPQMILAGASVDDVFVIVLFTTFTSLAQGQGFSVMNLVNIPVSILLGSGVGLLIGWVLCKLMNRFRIPVLVQVMLILTVCFFLNAFEEHFSSVIPFAALIGVMSIGIGIRKKAKETAVKLSEQFNAIWKIAEIFLFVLVGASVAITSALDAGFLSLLLLLGVLIFRTAGVFLCLLRTNLRPKERLFCMIAYTPKATVQAAIGGLPLAMGLPCGELVLAVSVISILLTAPLGAFGIDLTYRRLLGAPHPHP